MEKSDFRDKNVGAKMGRKYRFLKSTGGFLEAKRLIFVPNVLYYPTKNFSGGGVQRF